jgi:lipopolysaccharide export system protein LptA
MMCSWTSGNRRSAILVGVAVVWLLSVAAKPAPGINGTSSAQAPSNTTITASKMTVRNQENKAVFEGTVKLTKGNLVVHSDVMVVFFKAAEPADVQAGGHTAPMEARTAREPERSEKAGRGRNDLPIMSNRSVSMIEATGRVLIEKEDGRATCRKAVYHGDEEKIVLTGEPVAWQKGTRVTGKRITMFLAEDRSIVEGGSRVMIQEEGGS